MLRHKRYGFDPWVRKIPWRREWQPTPARPGHRALARSSLLRDWFPCAGAVLSLAQTHRGIQKEWAKELNRHFSKEDIQMAKKHMKRCSSFKISIIYFTPVAESSGLTQC